MSYRSLVLYLMKADVSLPFSLIVYLLQCICSAVSSDDMPLRIQRYMCISSGPL